MAEKLLIFWQIENFMYVIIMGVKMEEILGLFLLLTGKNSQFLCISKITVKAKSYKNKHNKFGYYTIRETHLHLIS